MDITSKTGALASPKLTKPKPAPAPSMVAYAAFGCEHIHDLFMENRKFTVHHYSLLVQTINEKNALILQTHKSLKAPEPRPAVCFTPTYLCLQCPSVHSPELRDKHWDTKGHAFSIESRSGYVYCQECQDFIYDPTLEEVRLQRGRKRRKLQDYTHTPEDARLIAQNSTFAPCRAIGLRGFYNMGQTCFMSVIIQSLLHNPFIKMFYLGEGHKTADCEKSHCTSCALDEIFTEFYSVEKTEGFGAVNMLIGSWMGTHSLAGDKQQDAHEYLQFIFNSLHLENGGTTDHKGDDCSCIMHRSFSGRLQSTVTCDKCKNITTAFDPFMDLSLDLKSQARKRKADVDKFADIVPVDVRECLERFTGKEKLPSGEYTCHKCGGSQQNATKQLSVQRLTPVLTIHLKRFEHNKTSSKIETKVKFPLELDMYPYTTRAKSHPIKPGSIQNPPPSCVYELSSVVVHKGKIDSGHYVSYSREGPDWFQFDDVKVTLASEAEVLDANAYLLFYVLRGLEAMGDDLTQKDALNVPFGQ
ncbi:cysteine proteinase [Eremomyces bilateralis CBS 781.70]|uniref:Ubiquitin carboxyl-terminal hydrolase n=1 Tax=Eremomyces bilateralis CBS 781.70 TaxID=1392243 RepID=A0A6G1FRJ4_9PEZI|nr:cysteine proteinase [Eremomyces bilateralis CBS 781.70]KAF1808465.1 cysteine proteinase [Eremomyces bilateralis CBS 781.70]